MIRGPWHAGHIGSGEYRQEVVFDKMHGEVAEVLGGPDAEETAHLIAAAPDLYNALIMMLEADDLTPGDCFTDGRPNANWGAMSRARQTARAALGKTVPWGKSWRKNR